MTNFQIVRAAKELYVGSVTEGHNCDFYEVPTILTRWYFLLKGERNEQFILELWNTYGECYSGWCTASWGNSRVTLRKGGFIATHEPVQPFYIDLDVSMENGVPHLNNESFGNELFNVSYEGGDEYYPGGEVTVLEEKLKKVSPRGHDKPLVFLFQGESNVGKSTLGNFCGCSENAVVYETDMEALLSRKVLFSNVIVIGNKHHVTDQDVRQYFTTHNLDVQFVNVSFAF
ncbi:MAG: hypothetical protein ACRCXZ_09380 [Patescibacteria group bacterium]